jgi:bHLH factor
MDVNEFEQHYMGGHEDPMGNHNDGDMGFAAALAQHNADLDEDPHAQHNHGQVPEPNEINEAGQSASDTAAAAMAQYHTMTVPQSTEQAFMNQVNDSANERANSASADQGDLGAQQRATSFGDYDMSGLKDNQGPSNGEGSPTAQGNQPPGSGSKPQVGTEEWHKIRKDNHKEGKPARDHAFRSHIVQHSSY